ncbi:hypothetical protein NIES25_38540 [Nostoc linckia NIES-25]|nr:hypothetical protein NIES25_38540 [Nostoc linckia NIES-25]
MSDDKLLRVYAIEQLDVQPFGIPVLVLYRTYAKYNESSGNTLREAAPRLHELPLRKNNVFSHILRKSCFSLTTE